VCTQYDNSFVIHPVHINLLFKPWYTYKRGMKINYFTKKNKKNKKQKTSNSRTWSKHHWTPSSGVTMQEHGRSKWGNGAMIQPWLWLFWWLPYWHVKKMYIYYESAFIQIDIVRIYCLHPQTGRMWCRLEKQTGKAFIRNLMTQVWMNAIDVPLSPSCFPRTCVSSHMFNFLHPNGKMKLNDIMPS